MVTSDVSVGVIVDVVCLAVVEGEKVVVVFASVVVGDREVVATVVISDKVEVVLVSVDEENGKVVVAFVVDDGGEVVDVVVSVVVVGTKVVVFVC